jgi:O-acetyl-ADP-ribose deacetylase (regulator of RNase III)
MELFNAVSSQQAPPAAAAAAAGDPPCLVWRGMHGATARYPLRVGAVVAAELEPRARAFETAFPAVGEECEAQWQGEGQWYPIVVRSESGGGDGSDGERHVSVSYEDGSGDMDGRVPVGRIRARPPPSVLGEVLSLSRGEAGSIAATVRADDGGTLLEGVALSKLAVPRGWFPPKVRPLTRLEDVPSWSKLAPGDSHGFRPPIPQPRVTVTTAEHASEFTVPVSRCCVVVPDDFQDRLPAPVRVFHRPDAPEMVTAEAVGVDGSSIVVQYTYETRVAGRKLLRKNYPANVCCMVPPSAGAAGTAGGGNTNTVAPSDKANNLTDPVVSAPTGTRVIFYHPENHRWSYGSVLRHHAAPGAINFAHPPTVDPTLNDVVTMWQGDITTLDVDGVQNAANEGLRSGGGICGAIFGAAGEFDLQRACFRLHPLIEGGNPDRWGGERCVVGDTKVTPGCGLHARHVLHTVGPRGEKPALLEAAYRSALDSAVAAGMESVALCCISTGIFGYPPEAAAPLAVATVRAWLEERRYGGACSAGVGGGVLQSNNAAGPVGGLKRIVFCLFLDKDVALYRHWMGIWFPRV